MKERSNDKNLTFKEKLTNSFNKNKAAVLLSVLSAATILTLVAADIAKAESTAGRVYYTFLPFISK